MMIAGFLFSATVVSAAPPIRIMFCGNVLSRDLPPDEGCFYFAIVNESQSQTLWSNNGTSTSGERPSSCTTVDVGDDGEFCVLLGDTDLESMTEISSDVFSSDEDRYLAFWFADESAGLSPEQLLPNTLLTYSPFAVNAALSSGSGGSSVVDSITSEGEVRVRTGNVQIDSGNFITSNGTVTAHSATFDTGITAGTGSFTGAVTVTSDLNVDSGLLKVDSANDRVGVGTSSPQVRFDVAGDARITTSQTTGTGILLDCSTVTTGICLDLDVQAALTGSGKAMRIRFDSGVAGTDNDIFVIRDVAGSGSNIFRIAGNGALTFNKGITIGSSSDLTSSSNISTSGNIATTGSGTVTSAGGLTVSGGDVSLPADTIESSEIEDGSIVSADIATDTIVAADISTGAVTTTEILDETIASADIADGTIASADIATDTIIAGDISTGAVTTTEILDDTIASADIATDTIVAADISTGAVTTTEILDETIASADIAADAVGASEIAESAVMAWTGNHSWTFGASGLLTIDASATANTGTTGVIDLNIAAGNAAVVGIDNALTQNDGATTATDAVAHNVTLTANDADGDMFGLKITAAATTNAGVGSYEAAIVIENSENTGGSMTDGILITSSGINNGIGDAIDASASNIANAINIGANPIETGANAGTIGSSSTTLWTITTDGTGDAEVTLPTDSISATEILDNTITATDLSATLTFADSDFIDLSSINASGTSEGIKLPQATSCSSATAEGQVCWDTDDDALHIGDGTSAIILKATIVNKTASYLVTAAETGSLFTNAGAGGAITFTLPGAAAGLTYTFVSANANQITVDPADGVDQILRLTDAAGDAVQSGASAGAALVLVAIDATNWISVGQQGGAWTDVN